MEQNKPTVSSNDSNVYNEIFQKSTIDSLYKLLKLNTTVPTHTPKSFKEQFYLYFDGSTTYELYVYVSGSWKKVTLS